MNSITAATAALITYLNRMIAHMLSLSLVRFEICGIISRIIPEALALQLMFD